MTEGRLQVLFVSSCAAVSPCAPKRGCSPPSATSAAAAIPAAVWPRSRAISVGNCAAQLCFQRGRPRRSRRRGGVARQGRRLAHRQRQQRRRWPRNATPTHVRRPPQLSNAHAPPSALARGGGAVGRRCCLCRCRVCLWLTVTPTWRRQFLEFRVAVVSAVQQTSLSSYGINVNLDRRWFGVPAYVRFAHLGPLRC